MVRIVKLHEMSELAKLEGLTEKFQNMGTKEIAQELGQLGINVSNMYQELEMTSRFVDTHKDVSYGSSPVNLHSHSFYEMICCMSNSGVQYVIGTHRYRLQRGDIVVAPPGVPHHPLFPSELAEPYERIVLWFSLDFIEGVRHISQFQNFQYPKESYLLRTANTPWSSIVDLFEKGLKEAQQKKQGWQTALCGNTMQLLTQFWRAITESPDTLPQTEKPELLDKLVGYIENNLKEKITLKDTSARFFVSESTISQTFQKKMNVSFYHYVTQRRLIAAKSMILSENNLDNLCTKVGFSDYSTFYRAFKKEFGISPREYRNLIADSQSNYI